MILSFSEIIVGLAFTLTRLIDLGNRNKSLRLHGVCLYSVENEPLCLKR